MGHQLGMVIICIHVVRRTACMLKMIRIYVGLGMVRCTRWMGIVIIPLAWVGEHLHPHGQVRMIPICVVTMSYNCQRNPHPPALSNMGKGNKHTTTHNGGYTMQRSFDVSTKQDKDSPAKRTALKVNYPDGLPTWVMDGFDAYLTVRLQSSWRNKGIPATLEVNAQDYAPGTRAKPMTAEEAFAALTPEQRQALIAKYAK